MSQKCDVCEKEIQEVDLGNGLELLGAKCLKFKDGDAEYLVVRCDECFKVDQSSSKKQKCEVFSRCCGYYRPVQNYNKGVKQQYDERLEFSQDKI